MRKGTKILVWAACGIVAAAILAIAALWLPPVQRFAAQRAAEWLATRLNASVGFEHVHLHLTGEVTLEGLYAVDNQGDTLLHANVGAHVGLGRKVSIRRIDISDGQADIKLIISQLGGGGGGFSIAAAEMRQMHLRYDTLAFDNVSLKARNLDVNGKDISLKINELNLSYLNKRALLSAPSITVAAGVLTMDNARIESVDSHLKFERLRLDLATKTVDATLQNSTVTLPQIRINNLYASILGTLDDLSAKANCVAGESTQIYASGRWQRGGNIFSLWVDTLNTTAEEIIKIAPKFTRKPLSDSLTRILRRAQPLSISGNFEGNGEKFAAHATVATTLGNATVNASLSNDNPIKYEVTLHDFHLGSLFKIKELGRATATATIAGSTANIHVDNIRYKSHDYQHITAIANLQRGHLDAHIASTDPSLVFNINLKSESGRKQRHDFTLDLANADLRAMGLITRNNIARLSMRARGVIADSASIVIDNILYINGLDSIKTRSVDLVAAPGYQKITSDLSLVAMVLPDFRVSGNSTLTAIRKGSVTTFSAEAKHLKKGSFEIDGLAIDGQARTDTIAITGNFGVGKQRWQIDAKEIIPQHKQLKINTLTLESGRQRITINGTASQNQQDTLSITAANFALSPLSEILRTGHTLDGRASGHAMLTAALAHPALTAAIKLDSLKIDHVKLPDLNFRSLWQNEKVHLLLLQSDLGTPLLAADYSPATQRVDGRINIRNIDLSLLDTHYRRTLSATTGRADITATIGGTPGRGGLTLTGDIVARNYAAKVDFLGVRYAAAPDTRLKINNNIISADEITMFDSAKNSAKLTAEIDLRNLRNVSYDFRIETPNLLLLDTSQADNRQFYGHVYASAKASITGGKQGTNIALTASTQPGSSFFMPLKDKYDVADVEYLTFAGQQPRETTTTRRGRLSTDIALTVEPNTTVELLIDPKSGHRMSGTGNGLLNLHISPREGEFTIYGDYRINEGTYLFTLENIIEKPFIITPGSTIQWTGNPRDARLNIAATHNLKTSITPAVADTGYDSWRMRIPVECRITLSERLSAPLLTFGITAPTATPETQSILTTFLDTPEMTATQFFFLLATGNFYDYGAGAADIGAAMGTTTAFDFLSSRLSDLIQLDNTNIGIRYRPQTETTSDEWGVDFSHQLWGERLLLEAAGNYDTHSNQSAVYSENMRNFTGDFNITGIIDRRGTLRAKVFTRTITRFDENQGLQESGVGIYFAEDFNTFGDIFRFGKKRKKTKN